MIKHLLIAAALLPAAAHAESTHLVLTARTDGALKMKSVVVNAVPEAPGLSFVLPGPPLATVVPHGNSQKQTLTLSPNGNAIKLPPRVLLSPLVTAPGSSALLALPAPPPSAPPAPMRLLVLRDDDRAVIRTIHPLLTSEVPVETILVKPASP